MEHCKIPESVLVVIYTEALEVLLLERADHPGFWQSVTGSRATADEPWVVTCAREVAEETGLPVLLPQFDDWRYSNRYSIYPHWRHRYAPGVTHNTEHVFGLCLAACFAPRLSAREHSAHQWLPWRAAADRCFSWTNAQAVRRLADRDPARAQGHAQLGAQLRERSSDQSNEQSNEQASELANEQASEPARAVACAAVVGAGAAGALGGG